jgi:hypothetical protein
MSQKSKLTLKSQFVSGTAATSAKFEDLIDSSYNKIDDSILYGPLGVTGKYGLLGPTGGTYNGLIGPAGTAFSNGLIGPAGATFYTGTYLVSTAPTASNSNGSTGQVAITIGTTASFLYIHNGTAWSRFLGATSW